MGPFFLTVVGSVLGAAASSVFESARRKNAGASGGEVGLTFARPASLSVRPSTLARPALSAPRPSFPGGLPQSRPSSGGGSWGASSSSAPRPALSSLLSSSSLPQLSRPLGGDRPLSEKLALALRNVHLTDLSGPSSLANASALASALSAVPTSTVPGGVSYGSVDLWPDEDEDEDTSEESDEEEMGIYDNEEVGADEIYINETAGDEDEVGAKARPRPRARGGNAPRRIAFIPATSIPAAATVAIAVSLNKSFKGIGIRLSGTNQDKLLFNGATIRGTPQEASTGSIGCEIFTHPGETYFWEWDTASPGESFTLSFTNTHSAAVVPSGYLIGYMSLS